MRTIFFLHAVFMVAGSQLHAQSALPYSTSTVQGSTIITNFIDPNAGPNVGPGLSVSPLDSRLNAPLGTPFTPNQVSAPAPVSATYGNAGAPPVGALRGRALINQRLGIGTPADSLPDVASGVPVTYPAGYTNPAAYPAGYTNPAYPAGSVNPAAYPAYDANGLPIPARAPESLIPVTGAGPEPFVGYPADPTYLFPGLVRMYLGQWVGSDYLYNMYPNIGVVVEVVSPSDLPYLVDSDQVKQSVGDVFASGGIIPFAESLLDSPPLPFFHVIVLITPVNDAYAFSISARFFEGVKVDRLNFRIPGTVQAITWEKQELVTTSQARLSEQVLLSARELADTFIQRINYFKRQKLEQDEQLKMKCAPVPSVRCPPRLRAMGRKSAV